MTRVGYEARKSNLFLMAVTLSPYLMVHPLETIIIIIKLKKGKDSNVITHSYKPCLFIIHTKFAFRRIMHT